MEPIRKFLTSNPAVTSILSVVLVGASIWFIVARLQPEDINNELQSMVYFYDLNTKELFEVPAGTLPPMETESGPHEGMPAGVRAHVFSRGTGKDWFIGYLETVTESLPAERRPKGGGSIAIRSVEEEKWHDFESAAGNRIRDNLRKISQEEGRPVKVVHPIPQGV